MSARRGGGGIGSGLVRFVAGIVVAVGLLVAAFVVFSGLTELPQRPPLAARAPAPGQTAPGPLGAAVPGTLEAPATAAPAPRASEGVAAPRPSGGGTVPGASAPVVTGTESSGLSGGSGGTLPGNAPSAPGTGAPVQPTAPGMGVPLDLIAPSVPGGATPSGTPPAGDATPLAPADTGALAPIEVTPAASVEEARDQLAALLGETPAAPAAALVPEAPAPETSADPAATAGTTPAADASADPAADLAAVSPAADATPAEAPDPAATVPDPATTAPDPAAGAPTPATPAEAAPVLALAGPAIEVNARDFQLPAGNAGLAFVVSDAAEPDGITPDMLAGLPFPITLGIVPGSEAATALAEAARAAGHEVLIQLPTETLGGRVDAAAALASDLGPDETAARALALLAALPQGVAVATYPAAGPAGAAGDALMALLARHGFGYFENRAAAGGVAELGAKRAGVPFIAADRTIARRATRSQFTQQLDAAASDAARGMPQVVLVPATAEALRALVGWSLERGGKARAVPLSMALRARAG